MIIACLSGKGGAGKTLTAVNLAIAAEKGAYIDCDVEEPNGRLFFKPEETETQTVYTLLPEFDENKCTGCRQCVAFCRFHALVYLKGKPRVFSEICHSCAGCMLVCPEHAVFERKRPVGVIEKGKYHGLTVVTGILNPGEATGVPVIRKALEYACGTTIIDCPPGSACSVMESAQAADYCVLVAEPTAFGFHNFKMVYELCKVLNKPCGVIINKQEKPYQPLEDFCKEHSIPILLRIPYDRSIAAMTARGEILSGNTESYRLLFKEVLGKIGGGI